VQFLEAVVAILLDFLNETKAEFKRPLLREVQKSGLSQVY
jgi:hypothetical protein